MTHTWLAGDVGATKTDLAIFSAAAGMRAPLASVTLSTADYASLSSLVSGFLAQAGISVDRAVFAVAGPVVDGRVAAAVSHLPWEVDRAELEDALRLVSVRLINDLEAAAQAIPFLTADDLHTLSPGHPVHGGAIAVIAPGTGLGEAFLVWDGTRYRTYASEGGHAGFAPTTPFEEGLLRYVRRTSDHISCELVCSGLGIPNIYGFLKESGCADEPGWLSERLAKAHDPTPVIVDAALDGDTPCELCSITLSHFISILGSEAGNLALKVIATGGVYLGGGIPRRILSILEQEKARFLDAFCSKGIMTEVMAEVPVRVIVNPHVALLGAACSEVGTTG